MMIWEIVLGEERFLCYLVRGGIRIMGIGNGGGGGR